MVPSFVTHIQIFILRHYHFVRLGFVSWLPFIPDVDALQFFAAVTADLAAYLSGSDEIGAILVGGPAWARMTLFSQPHGGWGPYHQFSSSAHGGSGPRIGESAFRLLVIG
jgi:hypothetical protein